MMQSQTINIKNLPNVSLENTKNLPISAGIYFVVSDENIQYIGKSISLRTRWLNHHRMEEIKKCSNVKIHYLIVEQAENLNQLERRFISFFFLIRF
ncbi:GIY-YIG nuclease family protein [Fischerella sp. PCC 9605]|uniref:GIY-YIG nuclease family protein n=1 Tax=Fischerella sp. PCC 9605 TaxID=1173024 RepID=UPI00047A6F36|nr:GIY-YIG nuclease family protein [Fischerella sp. PCC 9605]